MHCYQLLLRIYSTMEVLWMFYSFCGKPLPEQIFSEVYMSSQACIICTHDNSSMTNTCSFPRCWGLSLDFALQHIWPTYQRPQISRESVKKHLISTLKQPIQPRSLGTATHSFPAQCADRISFLSRYVITPRRVTINSRGPPKVRKIWLQSRAEKTT